MKKTTLFVIAAVCLAVILSSFVFSSYAATPVSADYEVKTVAETNENEDIFLLMLNKNYVYGVDFDNVDDIVNCSVNVFKDSVDQEGYIPEKDVISFVYDMYGIEIVDLSKLNGEYPYKEGYVYAVSGFTAYKHSNISVKFNEDGTVTATTNIAVTSLDGDTENLTATTVFVKNNNSKFGYNILTSEISSDNQTA